MMWLVFVRSWDFEFTGQMQQMTFEPGTYLLECWGAQRGLLTQLEFPIAVDPSYGGFSRGTLTLGTQTTLYLFVGGMGTSCDEGGWNGGGRGGFTKLEYYENHKRLRQVECSTGGGGSDISLVPSDVEYIDGRTVRSEESLNGRIIVAGGASGTYLSIFTMYGAQSVIYGHNHSPGPVYSHGGGVTGLGDSAGTQKSAGAGGGFGYGANSVVDLDEEGFHGSPAGGGGWYGGGSSGGGGSGYIKEDGDGITILDGETFDGSQEFLSPAGELKTGHAGNGHIRVTLIPDEDKPSLPHTDYLGNVYRLCAQIFITIVTLS